MPDQKPMWTRCLGEFSVMWVTILLISPVKKRIFAQNDQIWPKIGIFGWYGPGHAGFSVPCWWVGWRLWRAGCISQDTYLLYWKYSNKKTCLCSARISRNIDWPCNCTSQKAADNTGWVRSDIQTSVFSVLQVRIMSTCRRWRIG